MIWFFTPYSIEKKMFSAWDKYMDLVPNPDDWVCMMDGDILFLRSDFGHHIQAYIDRYPDTGIFTCYASRSGTPYMMPEKNISTNSSIIDHRIKAEKHYKYQNLEVADIEKRVTGHLMVIKKATWLSIRNQVSEKCIDKDILSVDSAISNTVLACGMKIRLMKGIYVLHYYRLVEGAKSKKHLI